MSKSPAPEAPAPGARVLLVDDHSILRAGIRTLLEATSGFEVVAEAGRGEAAEHLVSELRPEVVLMDVRMPGCGGIEATRRIRAARGAPPVLILTMGTEEELLLPATEAGATGFLRKDASEGELFRAIRTLAGGEPYFGPVAARLLTQRYRQSRSLEREAAPTDVLSDREREVLIRVANGYTSNEIGAELRISPKTVDTYRARVMEKLGLQRRSDLVRLALRHDLLSRAA